MKKIITLAIILSCLCSCYKDDRKSDSLKELVFWAGFEESGTNARTFIDNDLNLYWNKGDKISIFRSTYNQEYIFNGETGDNSGSFSKISAEDEFITGVPISTNYAVYPYSPSTKITKEGMICLSLPEVQHCIEGSFGPEANTMVAVTKNSDDNFLLFNNLCGFLVLKIYGEGRVKSIKLEGHNMEKLSGEATVLPQYGEKPSIQMEESANTSITLDCGEGIYLGNTASTATSFWICVPPTVFSYGFTITVTDCEGNIFEKSTKSKVTVERNVITPMATFEAIGVALSDFVSFNDYEFETYCLNNFDSNKDGKISMEEAQAVTEIDFSFYDYVNNNNLLLEGIQYFKELKKLTIYNYNNNTTVYGIDLSHNVNLEYIEATNVSINNSYNNIVNLSNNKKLNTLFWSNYAYFLISKGQTISNFRYREYDNSLAKALGYQNAFAWALDNGIIFYDSEGDGSMESISWGNEID